MNCVVSHAFRLCGDFLLFSWKGRKVNGLRRLKESLGPSGSALTRFEGGFGAQSLTGVFKSPEFLARRRLRPVPVGGDLGSQWGCG